MSKSKALTKIAADVAARLTPAQAKAIREAAYSPPVRWAPNIPGGHHISKRAAESTRLALVTRGLVRGTSLTAVGERVRLALISGESEGAAE